jgi:2-polyprenyl-3-methyl-5-hydroxy-6-metoxy-1,4-benzoquinol methylase
MLVDRLNHEGYEPDGVDSSTMAIKYENSTKTGRFFLMQSELLEGTPPKKKYDLITANHLIEHLRYPKVFLEMLWGHLVNGEYICIETPNLKAWEPQSIRGYLFDGGMNGLDHRICYTPRSLSRLLQESHFIIHRIFTRTYSPIIFDGMVRSVVPYFLNTSRETKVSEQDLQNCHKEQKKKSYRKLLKRIYKSIRNSSLLNVTLHVPNRIIEFNDRGIPLIIIARKPKQ